MPWKLTRGAVLSKQKRGALLTRIGSLVVRGMLHGIAKLRKLETILGKEIIG